MANKSFSNRIKQLLTMWHVALKGEKGIKGTIIAVFFFVLFILFILKIGPFLLKSIFFIVVIFFALLFLVLAVVPYVLTSLAKKNHFATDDQNFKTIQNDTEVLFNEAVELSEIKLNARYAHINLFFTDAEKLSIEYSLQEGSSADFTYSLLYDQVTKQLEFKQGINKKVNPHIKYNLLINIPKTQSPMLHGYFIEGSLNVVGAGSFEKFDVDAVNVDINFKDVSIESLRLAGLNLNVNASMFVVHNATVKCTGSKFNLSFPKVDFSVTLKTNSAVTAFSLNNKPLGKIFTHNSFMLWQSDDDKTNKTAIYDFNAITSQIDFYTNEDVYEKN